MDNVIRWGIVGMGNMARQFAGALRGCAGARLVAVGSRSQARAAQFGREFGVAHCHGSCAALAEDGAVDVAYIATPHPLHRDHSIACLEAGKAVLCEKPLTINAAEAREVMEIAGRRRRFLMEALWTRFLPPIVETLRLVAEGAIGEVRMVTADLGFRMPFDPKGRVFNRALGGGCLLDLGIYPVALATMVLGKPIAVSGQAFIGRTGVDEQEVVTLTYEGGRLAALSASIRVQTPQQACIIGAEGLVQLCAHWWRGGPVAIRVGERSREINAPVVGNGYQYEIAEVGRCLRAGKLQSDQMPWEASLTTLRIMDELRAQWGLMYPME